MATIEITQDNIEETINNNDIVLIDFWAEWCGPCKAFGPVFEAASEKHPDVVFGKCDTEAQQELAAAFQIRAIPTLAVFREQIMIHAQPGMLPPPELERLITTVKELDMEEVRAKVAEHEAKHQHEGCGCGGGDHDH